MERLKKLDLAAIEAMQAAYLWVWDRVPITIGMFLFAWVITFAGYQTRLKFDVIDLIVIGFLGIACMFMHLLQCASLKGWNDRATFMRSVRWIDYIICSFQVIPPRPSLLGLIFVFLALTIQCVMVRDRQPPEKRVLQPQAGGA